MIIVQAPLRISLFGGGTDFPSYYQSEGGAVLSAAIDKYVFIVIKKRFDDKLRIGYTQTEMVDGLDEIQHEIIRECLRKTGITHGVEITTMGDIPAAGSGLGSSSTVTVGSLHAMYTYLGENIPAERLAQEACEVEIEILHKPIGVQDQYISAYGGLRFFEFCSGGNVKTERVNIKIEDLRRLNESMLLFYTGIARQASTILQEQSNNIHERKEVLRTLRDMAYSARCELEQGNIFAIGKMLDDSWVLKKRLATRISNGVIDEYYRSAREAGAIGGKITGAGGGGFLLLFCPHERQDDVRKALASLQELPFSIEPDGSKVIFNYRR